MLLFLVASFFAYISYGIYQFKNVEFNISTDEDKIIIAEAENSNYIAEIFYYKRGAIGVGKSPSFLILYNKKTRKNEALISSDFLIDIKWGSSDSLKVFLDRNFYLLENDTNDMEIELIIDTTTFAAK